MICQRIAQDTVKSLILFLTSDPERCQLLAVLSLQMAQCGKMEVCSWTCHKWQTSGLADDTIVGVIEALLLDDWECCCRSVG